MMICPKCGEEVEAVDLDKPADFYCCDCGWELCDTKGVYSMSTNLMKFLLLIYFIIMVSSLYEKNFDRALYWFGALCITWAVLGLK